jgi:hypothetical protein
MFLRDRVDAIRCCLGIFVMYLYLKFYLQSLAKHTTGSNFIVQALLLLFFS